jgi:hypothetical protein
MASLLYKPLYGAKSVGGLKHIDRGVTKLQDASQSVSRYNLPR